MKKKFTSSEDSLLLLEVQQGSQDAFNSLYEKYWEHAYSSAYKRLGDRDQAKDVVQEIFVSIWLKKEVPILNLPAYLTISVRNRVFKLLEKQKANCPFFDGLNNVFTTNVQADADLLWKEFYRAYEELLTSLPPRRQKIFRLHYQKDMPTNYIAKELGISRKTVQNQLGKAVEQLRVSILQLFIVLIFILL